MGVVRGGWQEENSGGSKGRVAGRKKCLLKKTCHTMDQICNTNS